MSHVIGKNAWIIHNEGLILTGYVSSLKKKQAVSRDLLVCVFTVLALLKRRTRNSSFCLEVITLL